MTARSMTPELQRIAIAEACGWINQGKRKGVPALNHRWAKPDGRIYSGDLPDYLNDLNAMHEAEKVLNREKWNAYVNQIDAVAAGEDMDRLQPMSDWRFCRATAAQRAEAFLRTLGKWTEA